MRVVPPVLLILALSSVIVMPGVAGQEPDTTSFELELAVEPHGAPIAPLTGSGAATVTVSLACKTPSVPPLDPVPVQLTVRTDTTDAQATLSATMLYVALAPEECAENAEATRDVLVDMAFGARLMAASTVTFAVDVTVDGETVSTSWEETVGAYLVSRARFDRTVFKTAPDTMVSIPATLENQGNSRVRVISGIHEDTSSALVLALPPPSEIEPFGKSQVPVHVRARDANSYVNAQDRVVVFWTFEALDGDAEPERFVTSAVIQTQGVAGAAPSVAPVWVLLVLLGAGWWGRRHV